MSEFYDREGNPISMERWRLLFEDKRYQILKQTEVGNVLVSTVWMGIDHGFGYTPAPLIFETMTFHDGDVGEQYRYMSEREALLDHEHLVEQLRLVQAATT